MKSLQWSAGIADATESWDGLAEGQPGNLWLFGKSLLRLSVVGRNGAAQKLDLQPGDRISAVCQRSDGEVWFGTRFGQLRRLGHPVGSSLATGTQPTVRCLFEDRERNLWIGLENGGLVRIKPKRVRTFGERDGLPGEHITAMCPDGKRGFWVGCHSAGLAYWNQGEFLPFAANDELGSGTIVWSLARSPDGGLWIGTEGAGLLRWKDQRLERFGPEQGMSQPAIRTLLQAKDGKLWIGGRGDGLLCLTKDGFVRYGAAEGFDGGDLTILADDGKGGLWIGTDGSGLYHYAGGKFSRYTRADGLGSNQVRALLRDDSDVLWIGTTGGLTRLKDGVLNNLDSRHGLWDETISQVLDDGFEPGLAARLWLGSNHGVFRITKASIEDVLQGRVSTLEPVVYGRAEGMDCLECSGGFSPAGMVLSLTENPAAWSTQIWIPTLRGLARLEPFRLLGKLEGISGDHITFAKPWLRLEASEQYFDLGDVVAGGNGFGTGTAAGIDVRTGKQVQESEAYMRTDPNSDPLKRYHPGAPPFVDGVFIPGGKTVISSSGLRSEFPETNGEAWGLLKSGYRAVDKDIFNESEMKKLGRPMVWLSGNQGITFDLDGVRKATGKSIERFTAEACNLHIGPASFHVLLDGQVVVQRSGMVHDGDRFELGIVPLDIPIPAGVRFLTLAATDDVHEIGVFNRKEPTIIVEEVRADGTLQTSSAVGAGSLHAEFTSLKIAPGAGRLDFRYAAPSMAAAEKVRFRYRLEPLEKTWVEAGDRRTANYSNLVPGDYIFRVTACNNDGVWNEKGSFVSLTMLPHFWQRPWFTPLWIAALVLAVAGATGLAIQMHHRRQIRRLEQQRALAAERTRIARDLHDELGAGLTQVVLLSDMARDDSGKEEHAEVRSDRVSKVARRLARSLDEIVWATNPKNDSLDESLSFICKFAQDFLRTAGISCRLDWPEDLPAGMLSSSRRHHLYLAVREVLNNVVKHAASSEVRLRLASSPADLTVEIRDNGRGFVVPEPGEHSSRHGLEGIAGRMTEVGGSAEITSEPGQGTLVRLRLPLQGPEDIA